MSDITLLSKFLFSVEPCHSLLPNANLITSLKLAPRCLNICLVVNNWLFMMMNIITIVVDEA